MIDSSDLQRRLGDEGSGGMAVLQAGETVAEVSPSTARSGCASGSVYLAYSVTKTFLAVLALQLCQQRTLSLDSVLAHWHPSVPGSQRITLRHLLDHTAGLPDYGRLTAYHEAVRTSPTIPWSFEQFASKTYLAGLLFEPGEGWAYSNPGYMLVKSILESVAEEPLSELVRTGVAEPLGLKQTFVVESREELRSLAPARSRLLGTDGEERDVREWYDPGWVSHGLIASTPAELASFLHALFVGELLDPASLALMTKLVPVPTSLAATGIDSPNWVEPGYGLGLMGDLSTPWGPTFGHGGGGPGYVASVFHAPAMNLTVSVMGTREEGFDAQGLALSTLAEFRSRN